MALLESWGVAVNGTIITKRKKRHDKYLNQDIDLEVGNNMGFFTSSITKDTPLNTWEKPGNLTDLLDTDLTEAYSLGLSLLNDKDELHHNNQNKIETAKSKTYMDLDSIEPVQLQTKEWSRLNVKKEVENAGSNGPVVFLETGDTRKPELNSWMKQEKFAPYRNRTRNKRSNPGMNSHTLSITTKICGWYCLTLIYLCRVII